MNLGTQATDIRLCPVDRGPCDNLTVPSLRTQPSSHSLMAEHLGSVHSLRKARVRSPMGRSAPNLHATDPTGESGGQVVSPTCVARRQSASDCEVRDLTGELIQSLTIFA